MEIHSEKRGRRVSVAAFCLLLFFFVSVQTASGFKREYRMQVTVGPNFDWGIGAARFAKLVSEKTGGRIIVKPYYGSSLLQGAQLRATQMVSMGVIDCAFDSTINLSPVIPQCNIFSLPFFINTYDRLDRLENGKTGAVVFAALKKKGLMPLAWGENGFRQITNSRRNIAGPKDLQGLKVRVVGSPIFIDIFRQLGADPVNMNWGDAVTAFQQGVVDAQENPVEVLIPVQIWQYHNHVTLWNYVADPLIFYWNKREWDAFPKNIQNAIRSAALEAGRYEKALSRAGLDGDTSIKILKTEFHEKSKIPDPIAFMKKKKMTVTVLTDAQRTAFQKAVRPVYEKWVPIIGEKLVNTAETDMR